MFTPDLKFVKPSREYREMAVLSEIRGGGRVSQRKLARAAGVSATMINAYVDDLVGRGLLDVSGETNRTYRYTLTPEGLDRCDALRREVSREIAELYGRMRAEFEAPEPESPASATEAA